MTWTRALRAAVGLLAAVSWSRAFAGTAADASGLAHEATVVVQGTFEQGRGPCQWLPDGGRRWARLAGFTVTRVRRGEVRAGHVGVEPGPAPSLVEGREYVWHLRPTDRSRERLRRGEPVVLTSDEILAAVDP